MLVVAYAFPTQISDSRHAPLRHMRPTTFGRYIGGTFDGRSLAGRSMPFGGIVIDDLPAWRDFVASWYSGSGGSDGGGLTRTGTVPQDDLTVAVDPNVIPLHSTLLIRFANGEVKQYQAQDTGGAIIGNRVDIFEDNTHECFINGVQNVQILIVEK